MQIIKDLGLDLSRKSDSQLITQQYSDNELLENIFFSLSLGRFSWELSKVYTDISKAFKCQLQHGERGGGRSRNASKAI